MQQESLSLYKILLSNIIDSTTLNVTFFFNLFVLTNIVRIINQYYHSKIKLFFSLEKINKNKVGRKHISNISNVKDKFIGCVWPITSHGNALANVMQSMFGK